MGSTMILVGTSHPHRKNKEGKWQILTNPDKAAELAVERLRRKTNDEIFLTEAFAQYESDNEEPEALRTEINDIVRDLVKSFITTAEEEDESCFFFLDKPRSFTGGMSWGDHPTECFQTYCDVEELGFFNEPITDEEIQHFNIQEEDLRTYDY